MPVEAARECVGELCGQSASAGELMAPTLARYAKPNVYQAEGL